MIFGIGFLVLIFVVVVIFGIIEFWGVDINVVLEVGIGFVVVLVMLLMEDKVVIVMILSDLLIVIFW